MLPNSQAEKDDKIEDIKPVAQNHRSVIENGLRHDAGGRFSQNHVKRGEKDGA